MIIPQSSIKPFNIIGIPKIDISVNIFIIEERVQRLFEAMTREGHESDSYSLRIALEMMAEMHDGVTDAECSPFASWMTYNLFGTPRTMRLTKSYRKSEEWG